MGLVKILQKCCRLKKKTGIAIESMCLFFRPVLHFMSDLFCFVAAVIVFRIVSKSPGFTPPALRVWSLCRGFFEKRQILEGNLVPICLSNLLV